MARYTAENAALVKYLEAHDFPVEYFRQTLQDIKTWQGNMATYVAGLSTAPATFAKFEKAAMDRLGAMAKEKKRSEQVKMADARQTVTALDKATTSYQSDLDAVRDWRQAVHHGARDVRGERRNWWRPGLEGSGGQARRSGIKNCRRGRRGARRGSGSTTAERNCAGP
jgi:hypothetical protein